MTTIKHLIAATFLAVTLPLASNALANEHGNNHGYNHGDKGSACQKGKMHHKGGMHQSGVPPYLHGVKLTDTQKDQIFTLTHAQVPLMREQHKQEVALKKELHEVAKAEKFDDAKAQQIASKLAALEQEKVLAHARNHAKILALLTPEQRTEAQAFSEKMREAHGERTGFKAKRGELKNHHQEQAKAM